MKVYKLIFRSLALIITAMLLLPAGIPAQDSGEPDFADRFRKEELAQMLAPIALYPDSLIAQILMASTYPLEVVEAERWVQQNKGLKGDALDNALLEKTWDPSVKSLCHFPDLLITMSNKLDQTTKLGDAFLSQEDDVMDMIQELRLKAKEHGNLRTTEEQTVIVEREIIRVEPANPQIVYVPLYNPVYVYGPWWYPAYPPYYWYYPPGAFITGGFISFGPRFFIGFDFFSWSWFDWNKRYIYVDVHKAKRFHRFPHRHDSDRYFWRHDPRHRRGVAYRERSTSERFGQRPSRRPVAGPEMRGYPTIDDQRRTTEPSRDRIQRQDRTDTPRVRTEREQVQQPVQRQDRTNTPRLRTEREQVQQPVQRQDRTETPRVRSKREKVQRSEVRDTPFRGIGNGNFERKAGERGIESRKSRDTHPPSGTLQRQDRGSRDSRQNKGRPDKGQGREIRR